mgnify:CR=1 FL=1
MISIRLRGIQNYSDMKRYGSVIRVRPEKLEEYKKLHAEVWPGVRRMIAECGLRNYSIYYKDGFPCIRWQDGHCAHYNIVKGTVY